MREHMGLFRGKRKDNGKWAEGNLSCYPSWGRACIRTRDPNSTDVWEVKPGTVGECTGLRDRNGRLIFEGDIARFSSEEGEYSLYVIVWEYHRWLVQMQGDYPTVPDDMDESFCAYAEINGNIHDNPELVGGDAT